ncbi:hypothetical protein [Streptomyces sp. H27-D2]|uniref:hypothetical protein n=1 Tax=Streptomyces sp. H27-D2 TaxID=3046304 RepID=UPI002DB98E2C|nr:hypothetical protein [Streptomyces sp. H27-D2]MEC4019286.1 hypothetical protein [Streptomyces sp. H27-D2]
MNQEKRQIAMGIAAEDEAAELVVHSAAANSYTEAEVALSQLLLDQFVAGQASPAMLTDWLHTSPNRGNPRPRQREALLREWTRTA